MKRFVLSVVLLTALGLTVVYGEVEAVRSGYRIRQLNLQKSGLVLDEKQIESAIAMLKTPRRLEQWMDERRVRLTSSPTLKLARGGPSASPRGGGPKAEASGGRMAFARLFSGTAQADSAR